MMMQSNRKKPTTINIDKINGIENENEIDGYEITDEMKERFSNGISESFTLKSSGVVGIDFAELTIGYTFPAVDALKKLSSQIAELGLSTTNTIQSLIQNVSLDIGTWFTPEMHEAMRLFGERMREKQAIEVDRYNNFTNVGMSKVYGFDCSISTKKECSDFLKFIYFSFDREDERWQLSFEGFLMSITVTEWRDWGADYYILQKNKTLSRKDKSEKQLSTPAPKAEAQGNKQKAGRPRNEEVSMIDKTLYKNFVEMTISNKVTISKSDAIKELFIKYGNTFTPENPESTKSSIRRIIRRMSKQ